MPKHLTDRELSKSIHACLTCSALHPHWDRCEPPRLIVRPGEIFALASPDAANGILGIHSTSEDIANIDFRELDPLCGPVFVEGAEPGDILKVDILQLELGSWGWTGLLPGFGLLHEDFKQPYLRTFDLGAGWIDLHGRRFDLCPMMGVLGTAPSQDGQFASIAPTHAGGNIDVRYLCAGASLYLPVFNEGALLSGGDGHALQGEGEISGAAIEAPMIATLKVGLIKQRSIPAPFLDMSTSAYKETEYRTFLGIGPDLMQAAKDATRFAVDALSDSLRVAPYEAYALFGMIAELRIHEIVDQPNWVVGCMLPRRMF
jgi:acetamidase/formamidase